MALKQQKIVFGFLVMVTLTLQGCGMTTTNTTTTTTGNSSVQTQITGDYDGQAPAVVVGSGTYTGTASTSTSDTSAKLNGTFALTGTYDSPAGPEIMNATVTLKDDVITAVTAQNVAKAAISKNLQDKFVAGIAGQVVGKNINDVNVTYVNGSSLTAEAFDKALHDLQK